MINDKKNIMKAKVKINEKQISQQFIKLSININELYCDILNQTSDNLWWHCLIIIMQYLYLIFYGLNENVSLTIN